MTHMGKKHCLIQGLFGLLFIAQVKYGSAYVCQQATKCCVYCNSSVDTGLNALLHGMHKATKPTYLSILICHMFKQHVMLEVAAAKIIKTERKVNNEDYSVGRMHSTEQMITSCHKNKTQFDHIFSFSERYSDLFDINKLANQLQPPANVKMLFIHSPLTAHC